MEKNVMFAMASNRRCNHSLQHITGWHVSPHVL